MLHYFTDNIVFNVDHYLFIYSIINNNISDISIYSFVKNYVIVLLMNSYIVRSYRDVIVVDKIATRRTSKAYNIIMF